MSKAPSPAFARFDIPLPSTHWPRIFVRSIGGWIIGRASDFTYILGSLAGLLVSACLPRNWPRTVRHVLTRQILANGVDALGFVGFIALLTGASFVLQAQVLLPQYGTSDMMGKLLVTIIIRELGPLLISFLVIARSGNAIAIELGHMKIHGDLKALRIAGIDPGIFLVLPRVLGLCVSIVCLTIYFCVLSLASGWLLHVAFQRDLAGSIDFLDSIAGAIGTADVLNLIAKTVAPALAIGMISCTEGLNVAAATDAPHAASRAIKRSVIWVCVIAAIVSALTYL